MLNLFVKNRRYCAVCCAVYVTLTALVYALCGAPNPLVFLLLIVLGLLAILVKFGSEANRQHTTMLNKLYNELDAEGFLREYEPFLNVRTRNANLYWMVRLHLCNAYCALGRFDDAIRLLESVEYFAKKPEQASIARFLVTSHLCYCHAQKGDIAATQATLDALRVMAKELEALQEKKPEKKRMRFSLSANEQFLALLKGEPTDVDALKRRLQNSQEGVLSRVTTALWVARAELAAGRRREAEELLEKIAGFAPHLYPGQAAQALLREVKGDEKK